MSPYQPPELLAKQAHGTGTTRVFVVTEVDQAAEVACFAWCMASVARQPIALLARLGVDERHEGQGLGAALLLLLKDIRRTLGS
jgi:predicted N-acetyltransferase YhbS